MQLAFKNVMPFPIAEYQHSDASVWKSGFSINFPKKVLLNASSGKGKSTFVSILYGLRKDYHGQVFIDDRDIANFDIQGQIILTILRRS